MRLLFQKVIIHSSLAFSSAAVVSRAGLPLVQDVVPECSFPCLQKFISTNYPTSVCADTKGLGCLCTQRSLAGYTIGEAALQCVLTSCPSPQGKELQAYGLCESVHAAIPNTHSILAGTITVSQIVTPSHIPPMETSRMGAPLSSSMKSTAHDTTDTNFTSTTSATLSREPTQTVHTSRQGDVVVGSSMPSEPYPSLPLETRNAASSDSLSPNQIIGISVGSGAACLFGLGLLLIFFLRRRKRQKSERQKSEPFEIGGTMAEPSPRPYYFDMPRIPSTPIGAYNRSTFEPLTSIPGLRLHRASSKRSRTPSDQLDLDDIELESPSSMRTVSRLLPDKPDFDLYGRLHPITEKLASARPLSAVTIFEEDPDYRKSGSDDRRSCVRMTYDSTSRADMNNQSFISPVTGNVQGSGHSYLSPELTTHQNPVRSNPSSGRSSVLMNGTAPAQTGKEHFNARESCINAGSSSSVYSSPRPQSGDHTEPRNSDHWPHTSGIRDSRASSITSFETVASDDDRTNPPKRTTKQLSPVKENASRSPTPSSYLQVPPPINYSRSLRGRNQWHSRSGSDRVKYTYRTPAPGHPGNITFEQNPYHYLKKPVPAATSNGTMEPNGGSAGRFPPSAGSRAYHSPPLQEPSQGLSDMDGDHKGRRGSLWERKLDTSEREIKLSLRTT
ncbi:predicted protein [Uncinocarpus reesii 1704]|uniref:Extracellular membrane protein CFEM domain-containing protein n=1 Tax=Uncinocarpus reesii (strain UAMH 1704) TaxID=336963 RepID=C4JPT1_UNCRE|nr:uncharacterized protein UREG_04574 [Uncinocarpus reesii 1704]EEP79728.1 predicted protein [Uncinocarpus reesii 1704]